MHGYSLKHQPIPFKVSLRRAENITLLPVMTIDGYIACNVYKGSVTAELYENFVRDNVLPKCTPWPGPRSVIVMGNTKIHHKTIYS